MHEPVFPLRLFRAGELREEAAVPRGRRIVVQSCPAIRVVAHRGELLDGELDAVFTGSIGKRRILDGGGPSAREGRNNAISRNAARSFGEGIRVLSVVSICVDARPAAGTAESITPSLPVSLHRTAARHTVIMSRPSGVRSCELARTGSGATATLSVGRAQVHVSSHSMQFWFSAFEASAATAPHGPADLPARRHCGA